MNTFATYTYICDLPPSMIRDDEEVSDTVGPSVREATDRLPGIYHDSHTRVRLLFNHVPEDKVTEVRNQLEGLGLTIVGTNHIGFDDPKYWLANDEVTVL